MSSDHCPTEVNIWSKFRQNPPGGKEYTERDTKFKAQTRDLEL